MLCIWCHFFIILFLGLLSVRLDGLVDLVSAGRVKVIFILFATEYKSWQVDERITREQREDVHAFVELSKATVWASGISSVLHDWLAHLFSDHALNHYTWVDRLIHVGENDI